MPLLFNLRFRHRQIPKGNTRWELFKNLFANRYEDDIYVSGDYFRVSVWGMKVQKINVYLPIVRDRMKDASFIINSKKYVFDEVEQWQREEAYICALSYIIEHEYLHYIFDELGFGVKDDQAHWAMDRMMAQEDNSQMYIEVNKDAAIHRRADRIQ